MVQGYRDSSGEDGGEVCGGLEEEGGGEDVEAARVEAARVDGGVEGLGAGESDLGRGMQFFSAPSAV